MAIPDTKNISAGDHYVNTQHAYGVFLALLAFCLYHLKTRRDLSSIEASKKRSLKVEEEVLIVGAGISGICAAIKLSEKGIRFRVIEKEKDIGGTWLLNTYPGAACDVPAHLYSFSFEQKTDWSTPFAPQPEILEYLRAVVEKYGIRKHIQFNCVLKEASWNEQTSKWDIQCEDGSKFSPRYLINCIGG